MYVAPTTVVAVVILNSADFIRYRLKAQAMSEVIVPFGHFLLTTVPLFSFIT